MWVHWGLREEDKIWVVIVQHLDDADQGGDVGPCLLSVCGEKNELSDRRDMVRSMTKRCVPGYPNQGRGISNFIGGVFPSRHAWAILIIRIGYNTPVSAYWGLCCGPGYDTR